MLRLVHVSDLHFGSSFSTPRLWAETVARIPGLGEHSGSVAQALSNWVAADKAAAMKVGSPSPRVIATGDLTTWGTAASFQLAAKFLRGSIPVTAKLVAGLNEPNLPVIPGNHDVWNGWLLGLGPMAGFAPTTLTTAIPNPAPGAVYPPGGAASFPYQLLLNVGPPKVYLYGLDSTRVDRTPFPQYRNFLAEGFIDLAQLTALNSLVAAEPPAPSTVRIAAVHHPLAYAHKDPNYQPRSHGLLNQLEVVAALQGHGFSLVLSGHLHHGYVRKIQNLVGARQPLYVLAVGTATQAVRLSRWEKQLLRDRYSDLTDDSTRTAWKKAAAKCNEFRTYDLETDVVGSLVVGPLGVKVTVHRYWYNPNKLNFEQRLVSTLHL